MFVVPAKLALVPSSNNQYTVLYYNRFITLFTQIYINKKIRKIFLIVTVQCLEKYSGRVQQLAQGLASGEQGRRVTDSRRERRWEVVELKGGQNGRRRASCTLVTPDAAGLHGASVGVCALKV